MKRFISYKKILYSTQLFKAELTTLYKHPTEFDESDDLEDQKNLLNCDYNNLELLRDRNNARGVNIIKSIKRDETINVDGFTASSTYINNQRNRSGSISSINSRLYGSSLERFKI